HVSGIADVLGRSSLRDFVVVFRIQRPKRPTPFPYTTLFRSGLCGQPLSSHKFLERGRADVAQVRVQAGRVVEALDVLEQRSFTLDRKSTRLNSSHVKISYAVFCLKTKTGTATYRSARSSGRL